MPAPISTDKGGIGVASVEVGKAVNRDRLLQRLEGERLEHASLRPRLGKKWVIPHPVRPRPAGVPESLRLGEQIVLVDFGAATVAAVRLYKSSPFVCNLSSYIHPGLV